MGMEAPEGLVLWGYRAWSKSHQAFYDKAFEGVCLLKKEGQVLLRSAKHPWFLQYLVKKLFCITLYQKCQKPCVEHEISPRITILWLSGHLSGGCTTFLLKNLFAYLRSEPAKAQFLMLPLVPASVSNKKFGSVITVISLQVRELYLSPLR